MVPTGVIFEPCLGASVANKQLCQTNLLASLKLTPGQAFPGNVIPAALIDPNAVTYLNMGILPKADPTTGNAVSAANTPITVRDDVARVDHQINDKWQLMGHYMHDSVTQAYGQPELGWLWASYNTVTSTLSNPSNSAALKLSGTITPNLLVESSINYDGNIIDITNSANSLKTSAWTVNPFFNNGHKGLPGITGFGNPYGTAEDMGSAPWHNAAEDYEPKLDVSYTEGKHAMKFGFSYNRYTKNQQLFGDSEGDFSFGGASYGQYSGNQYNCNSTTPATAQSCVQGDGIVDMMLGLASSYSQYQATPINHYVNQTPSVYAMDNWHVTPRLTLQLGLRYDALPHAWERANHVANFDATSFLSSATPYWQADHSELSTGPGFSTFTVNGVTANYYVNGMRLAGQGGFPSGLVTNDYKTLQPRIGFSEDIFGNGKTVLRGGVGTFYERMQGNDIYNAATNAPFANNPKASYVNFTNPSQSITSGATAALPFFANGLTTLAPKYSAPAVAQYSLGVQHELAPSVIWVIQYVGNLAWHQNIENHINNFSLNTPMDCRANGGSIAQVPGATDTHSAPCTAALGSGGINLTGQGKTFGASDSFRTYNGWGDINQQENSTNGSYNGFQTGVRVQNKWGLSGELDYTWSHEIDLTTYDLKNISNPWYYKYDKGSGFLDRRQMLSANYMYHLPIFAKSNGLAHAIAGGWELAGTAIFENGVPVATSYNGSDTIGLGGGYSNRPNATAKMTYARTFNNFFDKTKLTNPTAAWAGGQNQGFGNAGKDAVVGPGRVNFTTSLYKSFAITERAHFELRIESFNTFNHTEFNSIDTTTGDGNFGKVTNVQDPRTLELGGKFVF